MATTSTSRRDELDNLEAPLLAAAQPGGEQGCCSAVAGLGGPRWTHCHVPRAGPSRKYAANYWDCVFNVTKGILGAGMMVGLGPTGHAACMAL